MIFVLREILQLPERTVVQQQFVSDAEVHVATSFSCSAAKYNCCHFVIIIKSVVTCFTRELNVYVDTGRIAKVCFSDINYYANHVCSKYIKTVSVHPPVPVAAHGSSKVCGMPATAKPCSGRRGTLSATYDTRAA